MRSTVLLTFVFALVAVAAPVPKAVKKPDDGQLLAGRWESVTVDTGGGTSPDSTWWLEVKDGKLSTGHGRSNGYITRPFKLDPDASPKQLDIDDLSGRYILSIYKLEGDTLTWCESSSTTNRASDFQTVGGFNVFVFKRVKEENK